MKRILTPAQKKTNKICNLILFAALVVVLIIIDMTSNSYDMISKVLQNFFRSDRPALCL